MSRCYTARVCSYDAATAGLSYSIDFTTKGLRLAFGGWNDKMPDFIQV
jgi:secreted Zn-dependent insulinase-like peptidase